MVYIAHILVQQVNRKENNMELNNYELINISGGNVGISATMINAIARGITVVYSLGRAIGSAIRYALGKRYC